MLGAVGECPGGAGGEEGLPDVSVHDDDGDLELGRGGDLSRAAAFGDFGADDEGGDWGVVEPEIVDFEIDELVDAEAGLEHGDCEGVVADECWVFVGSGVRGCEGREQGVGFLDGEDAGGLYGIRICSWGWHCWIS